MKGTILMGNCLALLFAALTATPQVARHTPEKEADTSLEAVVARLTKELSDLKVEVLQLRLEAEQARLESTQREARDADEELRQLISEEHGLNQEVEDLRKRSLEPTLSEEQRAEIAATTSEIASVGAARLRAERAEAERRVAAVRARFARMQETYSQLLARAAAVGITTVPQGVR